MLGPLIVNAIADARIEAGVQGPGRYTPSFAIMIGPGLAVGAGPVGYGLVQLLGRIPALFGH